MSQQTLQKLLSLFVLLLCFNTAWAQDEEIAPLRRNPAIIEYLETKTAPVYAKKKRQILKLPFFDDFSTRAPEKRAGEKKVLCGLWC